MTASSQGNVAASEKRTGNRVDPKLTRKQQQIVVAWLAMGDTLSLVVQRCQDDFGVTLNRATLYANYHPSARSCPKKWRKFGARVRRFFERNITRIPIARKEVRLKMLQEAADETLRWRTKSVNEFGEIQEKKVGILAGILDQARQEIEGDARGRHGASAIASAEINVTISSMVDGVKQVLERRRMRVVQAVQAPASDNGHDNGHPPD